MPAIEMRDFPATLTFIESLGDTDEERARELGVKSGKTIERLRRRIPAAMAPFVRSKHAATLLRTMIDDIKGQRKNGS